jgi:hypothetical protein
MNNIGLQELKVYQKAYDFYAWSSALIFRLARVHKYSLGIEIEKTIVSFIADIIRAYYLLDKEKDNKLGECLVSLEIIQIHIRMGHEMRTTGGISAKNYEVASEKIDEIRKMIFAWRKSLHTREAFGCIQTASREG